MRNPKSKSFERFYYERVGIGEGCGCAELIIGVQDPHSPGAGDPADAGIERAPGKIFQAFGWLLTRSRQLVSG